MKENLAKSREEAKHASEEVKYKHGVGLEDAAVDPSRYSVRKDVEIRTQGIGGLKILKSVKKRFPRDKIHLVFPCLQAMAVKHEMSRFPIIEGFVTV